MSPQFLVNQQVNRLTTQNNNIRGRRVTGASDAVDPQDYVTLRQLQAATASSTSTATTSTVPDADTSVTQYGITVPGAVISTPNFKGDHLSLDMFGITPNTGIDWSAQLQIAITVAINSGCALYIPPGEYKFSTGITVPGPLFLYGANETFMVGGWAGSSARSGSRLTYTGSGTAINVTLPSSGLVYRIHFEHFSLGTGVTSPTFAGVGIAINGEEHEYNNLEISGFATGILINHLAISSIHDCQFSFSNDHIYFPVGVGNAFNYIARNDFFAAFNSGIHLDSAVSCWIRFNYFESCPYSIWAENGAGFVQLLNTDISDNHFNCYPDPTGWIGAANINARAIYIYSSVTTNNIYIPLLTIHNNLINSNVGQISIIDSLSNGNTGFLPIQLDVQRCTLFGGTTGAIFADSALTSVGGRDNLCETGFETGISVPLVCPTASSPWSEMDVVAGKFVFQQPIIISGVTANQETLALIGAEPTPTAAFIGFYPDNAGVQRAFVGCPNLFALQLTSNNGEVLVTSGPGKAILLLPTNGSGLPNVGIGRANFNPVHLLHICDRTATSGITNTTIEAGAGQSTNDLLDVIDPSGNILIQVKSTGALAYGAAFVNLTALTTNTGVTAVPINGVNPLAGYYRVNVALNCTLPGTGGTVEVFLAWTGNGVNRTIPALSGISLTTPALTTQNCYVGALYMDGLNQFTYSVVFTSATGTPPPQVAFQLTLERLA